MNELGRFTAPPHPHMAKHTPEQDIKNELKKYIEQIGGYWCAVTGGAWSKPGDPDIVACVDGRFIGIEAKTPDGRLKQDQIERKEEIEDAHGIYLVIRSKEQLAEEFGRRGLVQDSGR